MFHTVITGAARLLATANAFVSPNPNNLSVVATVTLISSAMSRKKQSHPADTARPERKETNGPKRNTSQRDRGTDTQITGGTEAGDWGKEKGKKRKKKQAQKGMQKAAAVSLTLTYAHRQRTRSCACAGLARLFVCV